MGSKMSLEKELVFALSVVAEACQICRWVGETLDRQGDVAVKADLSPVSVADLAVQAHIAMAVDRCFAGDALLGEENAGLLSGADAGALRDRVGEALAALGPALREEDWLRALDRSGPGRVRASRQWILDPVDGTKGFLRGGQYAVALALVLDGRPVLGVLGCPNLPLALAVSSGRLADGGLPPGWDPDEPGLVCAAASGGGAFAYPLPARGEAARRPSPPTRAETGFPLRVSPCADPRQAVFCESWEPSHSDGDTIRALTRTLGSSRPSLRLDSQAKYAVVAGGAVDAYVRIPGSAGYRENVWDHAAGFVILQEAGGMATDLAGKALDFSEGNRLAGTHGVLATNGHLHGIMLAALEPIASEKARPRPSAGS